MSDTYYNTIRRVYESPPNHLKSKRWMLETYFGEDVWNGIPVNSFFINASSPEQALYKFLMYIYSPPPSSPYTGPTGEEALDMYATECMSMLVNRAHNLPVFFQTWIHTDEFAETGVDPEDHFAVILTFIRSTWEDTIEDNVKFKRTDGSLNCAWASETVPILVEAGGLIEI